MKSFCHSYRITELICWHRGDNRLYRIQDINQAAFEVLKNAYDKEKMQEVLQNDEKFSKVDRETVEAINLFAGTDIDIDEKEEVIDMCKAWEDQKNEAEKKAEN